MNYSQYGLGITIGLMFIIFAVPAPYDAFVLGLQVSSLIAQVISGITGKF